MTGSEQAHMSLEGELAFWPWLWRSGLRKLADPYLALHALVGLLLALGVSRHVSQIAQNVFLPFASVLVGLAFAWGGNAMALLQSKELHAIGSHPVNPGAYRDWVFSYQLAILVILVVLVVWGVAALGMSDDLTLLIPGPWRAPAKIAGRIAAFGLSSMAIRESWSVVLGVHSMLLAQDVYRRESPKSPEK